MKPGPLRVVVLVAFLLVLVIITTSALYPLVAGRVGLRPLPMAHRYGALLVAAVLCALGIGAVRRGACAAILGWVLLGMLGLQLLLGAAMVLADFPLPLALMHNLGAALLLGATVSLLWLNSPAKENL